MTECHGRDAALFQEIAAALGYKENKLPFTLLAQRVPLALLRQHPKEIEPMLFGVAGFLESPDLAHLREPTVGTTFALCGIAGGNIATRCNASFCRKKIWRLSGARPLNHPQRRVAALAQIAGKWTTFLKSLGKAAPSNHCRLLSPARASILELSLHAHIGEGTETNGAGGRFAHR